ncbi:hypothetical protein JCGZ_18773 [Jatropha curcas]|uniref:Uncharacterized protein n=1 Tax=Jatropha curcas TaxID=180498 RepID=A0A067LAN7_JATCU|nr:hypothetical protein JCGZ_18773 [Jatropha curcas]
MCVLEGMTAEDREEEYAGSAADSFLSAGDYATYFSTWMQARLPAVLEYTQERKKHRTAAHYRAENAAEAEAATAAPTGPAGAVRGDVPFPPGMEVVLDPGLGLGSSLFLLTSGMLLHHRSWILSMPHTCLLRATRSCASGLSSPGSSGDCGGTSLASPVLWPDSRWRWIGSELCWRWRGSLWTSPRRMMAPLPMMHHRLLPLRQLLVRAGGVGSSASVF